MTYAVSIAPYFAVSLILALSCFMVLRAGEISFGQQAFFGVGAYVGGVLTAMHGWQLLPAMLVAVIVAGLLAAAIGTALCRLNGFRFTLMTLVLGEFVKEVLLKLRHVRVVDGREIGPDGPLGFAGIDYFYVHGIGPAQQALLALGLAALCTAAIWLLMRGAFGRRLAAVAGDPAMAASLAIDPVRTRIAAFVLAGAIAGLGGALFAHHATNIDATNFSLMMGVHAVAYTLLGGLGSVLGPVVGTAIDIVLLEGLRVVAGYRMVAFGLLMVVMLVLYPGGILGSRRSIR